jgi:hypothetical protein
VGNARRRRAAVAEKPVAASAAAPLSTPLPARISIPRCKHCVDDRTQHDAQKMQRVRAELPEGRSSRGPRRPRVQHSDRARRSFEATRAAYKLAERDGMSSENLQILLRRFATERFCMNSSELLREWKRLAKAEARK